MDTAESRRKRLRRHFHWEINGHKDIIFVMVVFVPGGLVPIGTKPLIDRRHIGGKLSGA
jgi:hypothetical protein